MHEHGDTWAIVAGWAAVAVALYGSTGFFVVAAKSEKEKRSPKFVRILMVTAFLNNLSWFCWGVAGLDIRKVIYTPIGNLGLILLLYQKFIRFQVSRRTLVRLALVHVMLLTGMVVYVRSNA